MPARIDPFVALLLREQGEQLYLLPEEPVTMVKGGKPRRVSRQPLTDQHIYALLVEVAPSESADHIDKMAETEFEYAADRALVKVCLVPELGRFTAVVRPLGRPTAPAPARPAPPAPAPPAGAPAAVGPPPAALPAEFAAPQYQAAERALGELLRQLVQSGSSDLHLRVGEPPIFRTQGEIARQQGTPLTADQLELLLLAVMPERNRGEWKDTGDSDFAYEIPKLARFRVNAARDRRGPVAVFRVIPAQVVTGAQLGVSKEIQQLCYLKKGLVLVTGPTGCGKSTTLCALIDLINRTRTDHIITIEDPIEFVHDNKKCVITQRQVHVQDRSWVITHFLL